MGISVALCTYNGARFLRQQLQSIEKQSLLPAEVVISDDGSTDQTLSLIEKFAVEAPFLVRVTATEGNLGSTQNFERAIAQCRSPIVALADQDDLWKVDKLERLQHAFDLNPDASFVFTDADLIDVNGAALSGTAWEWLDFEADSYNAEPAALQFRRIIRGNFVTGATMAFRANLFPILRPFPAELYHDEWIATIAHGHGKRGIALPEPLIAYRQHSSQQIGVSRRRDLGGGAWRWLSGRTADPRWLEKSCADQAIGFAKVLAKLESLATPENPVSQEVEKLLLGASRHQQRRAEIFRARHSKRLPLVLRELALGRYKKFSGSRWRAVKDLLL